jgi:signal transduction histidine kinase
MASRVDALASLLDPGDRGARRDPEATAARARRLARELQKLVTDTGELTRAETDALHPEPIALAAFWAELGHDCERLPRPHGTTLRWGPAPDPRTVVTDPHKLAAVIRMLVAAMLAHTPEAEVRVDLVADGEAVAAHVTGAGLPARWHADDHATAPAPEDDDPATGWLGFHIVHRLAEQLGGSVAIEADDQRTSTVVVRLSSLQSTSGAGRAA